MDNTVELIKQKIGIKDLVGSYVSLKPAGKNLKGLCPFHKEKSPSFMVNPERQIWHCFGCAKGGDIFGFLMQYENIEFIEALKVLADRAGITLQRSGSADQKKYDILYEINRVAKDYFRSSLFEPAGATALKYLKDRGLTDTTIAEFELGLALPGNDNLMRHLSKMGYTVGDIERAGLAFKTERGTYWDRFRARIMFPLHNHFGKVIGFTGRVMPGNESPEVGKYVNSPETALFNKSKLLFGFFKSKNFVREQNTAVLVEGQMDFLMAWQDGVKNLVATSGTALTEEHLKLIRRLAENLVLSFDNDSAGKAAAERTIELAQKEDFNVRVIQFNDPTLKDPADIAKARPGEFANLVNAAIPAMEYYFSYFGVRKSLAEETNIAERKKSLRQALTKIKAIPSPIEQEHWINLLAERSGASQQMLFAEMANLKIEAKTGNPVAAPQIASEGARTRLDAIVQRILSLAIQDVNLLKRLQDEPTLIPENYRPILAIIEQGSSAVIPTEYIGLVNLLYLQSGIEAPAREIADLMQELSKETLQSRKKDLLLAIALAEKAKDTEKLTKLLEEYKSLSVHK